MAKLMFNEETGEVKEVGWMSGATVRSILASLRKEGFEEVDKGNGKWVKGWAWKTYYCNKCKKYHIIYYPIKVGYPTPNIEWWEEVIKLLKERNIEITCELIEKLEEFYNQISPELALEFLKKKSKKFFEKLSFLIWLGRDTMTKFLQENPKRKELLEKWADELSKKNAIVKILSEKDKHVIVVLESLYGGGVANILFVKGDKVSCSFSPKIWRAIVDSFTEGKIKYFPRKFTRTSHDKEIVEKAITLMQKEGLDPTPLLEVVVADELES